MLSEIPDHLSYEMRLLFVGFNPSLRSGESGHHYANPHNRFWRLLYAAGLTDRIHRPEEDGELLEWYGYGFTNIVARPTRTAAEITRKEYELGRERLKEKLHTYRPKLTCFVGKGVYEQFSGRRNITWGMQQPSVIQGGHEFVVPSSSGLVRMPFDIVAGWYEELKLALCSLENSS